MRETSYSCDRCGAPVATLTPHTQVLLSMRSENQTSRAGRRADLCTGCAGELDAWWAGVS